MAAWFRFDRSFDFRVKPGVEVAYLAGMVLLIPDAHAEAADAAKAGERIERPEAAHAHRTRRNARPASVRKSRRHG